MIKKLDIVVFDFDGTLSAGDAGAGFIKYCFKHSIRPWVFLPQIIVGLIAKYFNPYGIWWRQMVRNFITPSMVSRFVPDFIAQHKMQRFGWARERVATERSAGRTVLLISAGPDYLIPQLVADMKFDAVICSKMAPNHPGDYETFCYGPGKVIAMDEWARANKVIPNLIRSYGDSRADKFIMAVAAEQVWIDPRTGARVE